MKNIINRKASKKVTSYFKNISIPDSKKNDTRSDAANNKDDVRKGKS